MTVRSVWGFEIEKNKIRTSRNTVEHQNTSRSAVVIYDNTGGKKAANISECWVLLLLTNLSQAYTESSVIYSSISFIQS